MLIKEMIDKLITAKNLAKKVNIQEDCGETVFIYPPSTEKTLFNPKYLTPSQYFQLEQLEIFVKSHNELTDDQFDALLKSSKKFAFLVKVRNQIPNFYNFLKKHGAKSVAIVYINNKLYPNTKLNS